MIQLFMCPFLQAPEGYPDPMSRHFITPILCLWSCALTTELTLLNQVCWGLGDPKIACHSSTLWHFPFGTFDGILRNLSHKGISTVHWNDVGWGLSKQSFSKCFWSQETILRNK